MSIKSFFSRLSDNIIGIFSSNRHYITREDLERVRDGRGTVDVKRVINEVSDKINLSVGSTKLRGFLRAYKSNNFSLVKSRDLGYIANEMNVIIYGEIVTYKSMGSSSGAIVKSGYKGGKLNNSQNTWTSSIMTQVGLIGSSDVKACVRSTNDILQFIRIESGLNNDGTVNLGIVNSLGYCGPLQVGYAAWKDAISSVSPLVIKSKQDLIAATKSFSAGGPGDINIMAIGIVKLWNNYWKYLRASSALSDSDKIRINRMDKDWKTLYLLHNQGAGGFLRILKGTSSVAGNQSDEANLIAKEITARANSRQVGNSNSAAPVTSTKGFSPLGNVYSGLKIKSTESVAGGAVKPFVLDFARFVQASLGSKIKYFSAFNDAYHAKMASKHSQGLAFDLVLNNPADSVSVSETVRSFAKQQNLNVFVLNEYLKPSSKATGGHIHVQFN